MNCKTLSHFQHNAEKQGSSKTLKIKLPFLVPQLEDEQSNSKGQLKPLIDYYIESATSLRKPLLKQIVRS